jgi:hypothetical protein
MKKGAMQTLGRLVLRSPGLWNEPSLQARIDALASTSLAAELLDVRLDDLSQETGFPVPDLRELLVVAQYWRDLPASRASALAA